MKFNLLYSFSSVSISVYGRLNLSVDYVDADTVAANTDGQVWQLNSNASRIGVKGNEKLTDELTAVYKAEWDVKGDVGGADLAGHGRGGKPGTQPSVSVRGGCG